MRVVDRLAPFDYVLEEERGEENPTVWRLKGLPYDVQQKVQRAIEPRVKLPGAALGGGNEAMAEALSGSQVEVDILGGRASLEFEILSNGIMEVSALYGPGGEIEYPGPKATPTKLKQWFASWTTQAMRTELCNAITEHSTMEEDEAGN